jgi:hypothetical protein
MSNLTGMQALASGVALTALLLTSCGEDAAFQEQLTTKNTANAAASGGGGDTDGDGNDAGAGGTDTGTDSGNAADAGGSDADGAESGATDTGGEDGGGLDGSGEAGDDSDAGGSDDGDTLVEDGGTLEIPGVKVQRVGVNFEDHTDFDYNDAVMCFQGNFKIEGTNVVSYQQQSVAAKTYSASGCDHRVDVKIVHTDGTSQSFSYRSDSGETLQLPFRIKSRLEVTMTTIDGGCDRTPITMHDQQNALVKGDVCNNTGN